MDPQQQETFYIPYKNSDEQPLFPYGQGLFPYHQGGETTTTDKNPSYEQPQRLFPYHQGRETTTTHKNPSYELFHYHQGIETTTTTDKNPSYNLQNLQMVEAERKRGQTEDRGFFYNQSYDNRQTKGNPSYDGGQGLFRCQGRETTKDKKPCYPNKDKWSAAAGYHQTEEDKWYLEDVKRKDIEKQREINDMLLFYKQTKDIRGFYQTEDDKSCSSYNLQTLHSVQAENRRKIEDMLFFYKLQTQGKWSYDQPNSHQNQMHIRETEERRSFFDATVVDRLMYVIEQENVESQKETEKGFFLKCHDGGDKLWLRYSPSSLEPNLVDQDHNWSMYPCNRSDPYNLDEPYDPYHVWTIDERIPKLYIWLGLDNIFCLHLNRLLSYTATPKLKPVFSLCNKHNIGTEYPPGGLLVMDSKLHYLGGGSNKKVSSFNLPSFKPDHSTYFPDNLDCKARPIVFTISNKVYTLATIPVSMDSQSNLFEVFEPEVGKWRSLPAPPVPALCTLRSHCVFRNKLLLQTFYGDFIFDANAETKGWERTTQVYPKCCAVLEYEDLLLVFTREPFKLVAYELKSFGEIECTSPRVLHIKKRYLDFRKLNIIWGSLNHVVEDNCICLVVISMNFIHVFSFEVMRTGDDICANVKAYREIDIPIERSPDFLLYSTFLWSPPDVNRRNPADTKAVKR